MRKTKRLLLNAACFLCTVFVGAAGNTAREKQNAPLSLTGEQTTHFDLALIALSQASQRALVVEGQPFHDTLDNAHAQHLRDASAFPAVLAALCQEYDYEIISKEAGASAFPEVIALRKKYNRSNDLPDVTIEECLAALKDAQRLLRNATGNVPLTDRRKIVLDSLNAIPKELQQQLAHEGIPVRELNPYQRRCFERVALYFYLQKPTDMLTQCQRVLADHSRFTLSSSNKNGKHVVMVNGKDRISNWSGPLLSLAPHTIMVRTPPDSLSKPEEILAPRVSALSLREAVQRTGLRTEIQIGLAEKPVMVAGTHYATPSHIVKALAAVCGLNAISAVPNESHIRRPLLRSDPALKNLYVTLKQVLPLSLVRASEPVDTVMRLKVADTTRRDLLSRLTAKDKTVQVKSIRSLTAEVRNLASVLENRTGDLFNESRNRLEVLYEARAKGKVGYTIPLDELGPEGRRDFAVLIMSGFMQSLQEVSRQGPAYMQRFDQAVVMGGEEGSAHWVGLGMAQPGKNASPMIQMEIMR